MRNYREITGKAEIVLQQSSRSGILGFLQYSEQIQQPLTRLRDSRTSQLANLDQFAALGGQPVDAPSARTSRWWPYGCSQGFKTHSASLFTALQRQHA